MHTTNVYSPHTRNTDHKIHLRMVRVNPSIFLPLAPAGNFPQKRQIQAQPPEPLGSPSLTCKERWALGLRRGPLCLPASLARSPPPPVWLSLKSFLCRARDPLASGLQCPRGLPLQHRSPPSSLNDAIPLVQALSPVFFQPGGPLSPLPAERTKDSHSPARFLQEEPRSRPPHSWAVHPDPQVQSLRAPPRSAER